MVKYKLTYFDGRGLAEPIRYILVQAGVPFEDERFTKEDWPKIKPTTPTGQVPVLSVDGKQISQSNAIARYLAKEYGLAPADNWLAAKCDMLVDGVRDLFPNFKSVLEAKISGDTAKQKEAYTKFKSEHLAPFLNTYEKILTENGGKFFVGKELTWADLFIAEYLDKYIQMLDPDVLAAHKILAAHVKHVHDLPNIKKHVASRKETMF